MTIRSSMAAGFVAALLLVLSACSQGDDKKPCPANGIFVSSASGVSCRQAALDTNSAAWADCLDQLDHYEDYACEDPQICPDQSKRIGSLTLSPTTTSAGVSFSLKNCSTGNQKLTITKIVLYGDSRCSFSEVEYGESASSSSSPNEASPGESILIQTVYKPKTVGQDFSEIGITSNAKNYPSLTLAVCGAALPFYPVGYDSSVATDASVTSDASTLQDCKSVGTTVNTTCHKD